MIYVPLFYEAVFDQPPRTIEREDLGRKKNLKKKKKIIIILFVQQKLYKYSQLALLPNGICC